MTNLGCLPTVNDVDEARTLIENRVQMEACVDYNKEGNNGCPDNGAPCHKPPAPLFPSPSLCSHAQPVIRPTCHRCSHSGLHPPLGPAHPICDIALL